MKQEISTPVAVAIIVVAVLIAAAVVWYFLNAGQTSGGVPAPGTPGAPAAPGAMPGDPNAPTPMPAPEPNAGP